MKVFRTILIELTVSNRQTQTTQQTFTLTINNYLARKKLEFQWGVNWLFGSNKLDMSNEKVDGGRMEGKTFTQADDFSKLFGPPTEDRVWRYTTLGRLLNILLRSQLFFSRADKFNDILEGVTPGSTDRSGEMELQKRSFISCWNMSEHESYSLWKAYSNLDEGVAIQSTHRRLLSSISAGITPAPVIYLDHDHDKIDVAAWPYHFLQKDRQFQDEKEFRLLITDPTKQYKYERFGYEFVHDGNGEAIGLYVKIDSRSLIERIVTAPHSAPWFNDTLRTLINEGFGLDIPIESSALTGRVRY